MTPFIGYLIKTNFREGKVMGFGAFLLTACLVVVFAISAFKANNRASNAESKLRAIGAEAMNRQKQATCRLMYAENRWADVMGRLQAEIHTPNIGGLAGLVPSEEFRAPKKPSPYRYC